MREEGADGAAKKEATVLYTGCNFSPRRAARSRPLPRQSGGDDVVAPPGPAREEPTVDAG